MQVLPWKQPPPRGTRRTLYVVWPREKQTAMFEPTVIPCIQLCRVQQFVNPSLAYNGWQENGGYRQTSRLTQTEGQLAGKGEKPFPT